jgi:anti-sigma B factor antagonist
MDFNIEHVFNETKGCWDVNLSGEIDIFNSTDLKKRLSELLTENDAHLYLHCKNLEFIDSTGLGALVAVMKTVKANGKEMHLYDLKPSIIRMFKITNLDTVFIINQKEGDNA